LLLPPLEAASTSHGRSGVSDFFSTLESLWKSFQYLYAPRIAVIEDAIRTERLDDIAPFQIYQSWIDIF
jgi:hypothetical protein